MALAPGTRIASYEIVGAIGAGGMGEVYRARDLKLNRDVAIKVLPALFAGDPERLARFSREAQVLASLNHPNIAHVHGFEEGAPLGEKGIGAAGALVMELVDGPTLADRLARGPIPIEDAVPIARQIVAALEAAHAQGIVHRDLKPANIKIRADGTVKVLDFGLAKLASPDPSSSGVTLANSPTITAPSQLGMVVGTAAYMAPEQAKGKAVDKRADIWAFGAVLFEMLSGHQVFGGETVSEVLANVLKEQPKWSDLPLATPPAIRRLLGRCLEKDPKRRLHDIADALPDLDDTEAGGPAPTQAAIGRNPLVYAAAGLLVGIVLCGVALAVWRSGGARASDASLEAMSVLPPAGAPLLQDTADAAISPDGCSIAFVAGTSGETARLFLRTLDRPEPRPLPGTKGAQQPFWSADGSRLGFFADAKLKTIRIDSGTLTDICEAPDPRGGAWSPGGQIVFQPSNAGPLMKVSAEGGDPQPATTLDGTRGETGHRFPLFLPDGRHFLYAALPGSNGELDIAAGTLDDVNERHAVTRAATGVAYSSGYLIYLRTNGIAAQAFDPRRLTVRGDPLTLSDVPHDVASEWSGAPAVSVSDHGTLLDYFGARSKTHFVWYDTTGKEVGTVAAPEGYYNQVAMSPDGQRAAVVRQDSPLSSDIWILDLQRGGAIRLTNGPGRNEGPSWSPDGKRVAFQSDRNNQSQIYVKPADGSAAERQVTTDGTRFKSVGPWTRDGHAVVYSILDPKTQRDLWIAPIDGGGPPRPYLQSPFNEVNPTVSPDGRWLAYMSDETGQLELYVQSFPVPGNKYRVTSGGMGSGGWLPDGRIAYVSSAGDAYAVRVTEGPPFQAGAPQKLGTLPSGTISMDVAPDLKRTLASTPVERNVIVTLMVIQNWPRMLNAH